MITLCAVLFVCSLVVAAGVKAQDLKKLIGAVQLKRLERQNKKLELAEGISSVSKYEMAPNNKIIQQLFFEIISKRDGVIMSIKTLFKLSKTEMVMLIDNLNEVTDSVYHECQKLNQLSGLLLTTPEYVFKLKNDIYVNDQHIKYEEALKEKADLSKINNLIATNNAKTEELLAINTILSREVATLQQMKSVHACLSSIQAKIIQVSLEPNVDISSMIKGVFNNIITNIRVAEERNKVLMLEMGEEQKAAPEYLQHSSLWEPNPGDKKRRRMEDDEGINSNC